MCMYMYVCMSLIYRLAVSFPVQSIDHTNIIHPFYLMWSICVRRILCTISMCALLCGFTLTR